MGGDYDIEVLAHAQGQKTLEAYEILVLQASRENADDLEQKGLPKTQARIYCMLGVYQKVFGHELVRSCQS